MSVDISKDLQGIAGGCCSKLEQNAQPEASRRLFNKTQPQVVLKKEKYEHRIMAFLKAEGYSNVEIAKITGYSPVEVGTVMRQEWAEATILEIIREKGGKRVDEFLSAEVMPSLELYKTIRDDPEAARRDRLAAAHALLDRKYGKPNQPISMVEKKNTDQMTLEEVNARLAELEQLKAQKSN